MLAKIALFFSSYVPLFVIFAIRFPSESVVWSLIAAASALCGIAIVLVARNRHEPQYYPVASVASDGATAGYIATYVLPFVTIAEPTGRDLAAYLVFFGVLLVLTVRGSMIGVNPLVYLTPWRIFQMTTKSGTSFIIISRERPEVGSEVRAAMAFTGLLVRKE